MDPLVVDGSMTIRQWVDLASTLRHRWPGVLLRLFGAGRIRKMWSESREDGGRQGADDSDALLLARLHASRSEVPPAADRPGKRLDRHDGGTGRAVSAACFRDSAGPKCRGTRAFATRPRASRPAFPTRQPSGVTLILENHYKDNYWQYPEFAQKIDVFCELVDRDSTRRTSA